MAIARLCGSYGSGAVVILRLAPGRIDDTTEVVVMPIFVIASHLVSTLCMCSVSRRSTREDAWATSWCHARVGDARYSASH